MLHLLQLTFTHQLPQPQLHTNKKLHTHTNLMLQPHTKLQLHTRLQLDTTHTQSPHMSLHTHQPQLTMSPLTDQLMHQNLAMVSMDQATTVDTQSNTSTWATPRSTNHPDTKSKV